MPAIPSGPITVMFNTPDGRVFEAQAQMIEMSMTNEYPEPEYFFDGPFHKPIRFSRPELITTEITLRVIGEPTWSSFNSYVADNRKKKDEDWKCTYCGNVNRLEAVFCGELDKSARGCGASKPWTLM